MLISTTPRRALLATAVATGITITLGFQLGASSAADPTESLFRSSTPSAVHVAHTTRPTEVGMRFSVTTPGTVTGVKYFGSPASRGHHTGSLWTGHRTRLAAVRLPAAKKAGWRSATFSHGVHVVPGRTYVVSYYAPHGRYTVQKRGSSGVITSGRISARRTAGVYRVGRGGGFPNQHSNGSDYLVDVTFVPDLGLPTGGSTAAPPADSTPTTTPTPTGTPSDTPSATTAPTPTGAPTATTAPSSTPTTTTPTTTPTTTAPAPSTAGAGCSSASRGTPGGADSAGGCWPGPTTTGVPAGVALKRVPQDVTTAAQAGGSNTGWSWDSAAGAIRITASGAVISGVDVTSGIEPSTAQPKMTIVDSRFRCATITDGSFCGALGSNSTMTDSEIGGGTDGSTFIDSQGFWVGGSSSNSTFTRVNIHHIVHGLHTDGGATVVDSYLHDMPAGDPAGNDTQGTSHTNCVFVSTGGNLVFQHDTFAQCGNNSGIFVQDYDGTAEGIFNLTVKQSLFLATDRNGQQNSYGVGIENKSIKGADTIHVNDNVFGRGWDVGPVEAPTGADATGNTYTDGSAVSIEWDD